MKSRSTWEGIEGSSYPLGVSYIEAEDAFNFSIYSRHATAVSLVFYSAADYINPVFSLSLNYKTHKSSRVWHCRIAATDLRSAKYYAYKIDGPAPKDQFEWHAFDKDKVLLDPYAKSVFFPPEYSRQSASVPGANDGKAPLGVVWKEPPVFDWDNDRFIRHESELIIYEVHVRGFTFHQSSGLAESCRGTFKGLIEKIPYLLELGITAVELMPVQQFDSHTNEYWGYNTLNFFAPHASYCSTAEPADQVVEFKTMVQKLHQAGIEVILDVVYNHTGEGNHLGPVLSYKGIDNSTYYLINNNLHAPYFNCSGTGNTMHTRNSAVRRLILDSLHYWRHEMHVDGFRFDLASVFNRNIDGTISFEEPAVLGMIISDPDLATARFIAEPWDAAGAFYLGKKFPGIKWLQWNSAFRDDVRRFVKSDLGMVKTLLNRVYGSDDIFPDDLAHAFHAYQSINYVTAHDGFTLYDLVSYNNKHNEANGENSKDGAEVNHSWNCGIEGDENLTNDLLTFRKKQAKNLCSILLLSNGTPMFVAGDEFLRTQRGNNNPYNQDNDINWIDWSLKERNHDFFSFFKKMIAFRRKHKSLSRSRFWREDVECFSPQGDNSLIDELPLVAFYLNGSSEDDDDIYVMFNAHWLDHWFHFQKTGLWMRIVNTALAHPDDFIEEGEELVGDSKYLMPARSIAVFVKRRTNSQSFS